MSDDLIEAQSDPLPILTKHLKARSLGLFSDDKRVELWFNTSREAIEVFDELQKFGAMFDGPSKESAT